MRLRIGIPLLQKGLDGHTGWIAGFYYIKNCLNAIASLTEDEKPDITAFVYENFNEQLLLPDYCENIQLKVVKIPSDRDGYSFELQKYIDDNPCDVFFPFNNLPSFFFSSSMIGWIPDFQHKYLPHLFSEEDILQREITTNFVLKHSEKVICSSQMVARDIEKFYPDFEQKTAVLQFKSILPSSYFIPKEDSKNILKKFNIERKYIIVPNQFWVHKNHKMVFEAWCALKKKGYNYLLICTGALTDYRNPNYFEELVSYIKDNELEEMIRILGFVDRHEQIQLMRNAAAVLQPSLFEGWNTSIEDSKVLGKQLIVSDIPVHREQCQEHAYYFNKDEPSILVSLIEEIWDQLPEGYQEHAESNAFIAHQADIQLFARNLLNIFKTSTLPQMPFDNKHERTLVLKLTSQLQVAQAHLTARLDIIHSFQSEIENYKKEIENYKKEIGELKNSFWFKVGEKFEQIKLFSKDKTEVCK